MQTVRPRRGGESVLCLSEQQCSGSPWGRSLWRVIARFSGKHVHHRLRTKNNRKWGCGTSDQYKYWMNFEPCGLLCASFVHGIVLYGAFTIKGEVLAPWLSDSFWYWVVVIPYLSLAIMTLLCHLRAMLSNPGAVPLNSKPTTPAGWLRECKRCGNHKPIRAHHCSTCNRCIIKMDHHCPWVNNCVGIANQKYFVLFLLYMCSFASCSILLTAMKLWNCFVVVDDKVCPNSEAGGPIAVLILCILAVFAVLITGSLICEQVTVVSTNQTQIDRYHGTNQRLALTAVEEKRLFWDSVSEVVGGDAWRDGFHITWLLPTAIKYNDPEALTGYCFRDTPRPRTQAEMEGV